MKEKISRSTEVPTMLSEPTEHKIGLNSLEPRLLYHLLCVGIGGALQRGRQGLVVGRKG